MKEETLKIKIQVLKYDELESKDKTLVNKAIEASKDSYAPYSNFKVGAAIILTDGTILSGNNQENAAYPSGLCAERTTLFYTNANYPNTPIDSLAIAARNKNGILKMPISPCGSCRQAILEIEKKFKHNIRIIMYGSDNIYIAQSIKDLLPLQFDSACL
jgi:cytidine deaminase